MNPYEPRTADEARDLVLWYGFRDVGLSDPEPYWIETRVGSPYPKHWCGAFDLSCLRKAGLCDWRWIIGKGFLFHLRTTQDPKPGDTAYFARNQHHALVVGDGRLINGNGAGGRVTVTWIRPGHEPTAYYSIGGLVEGVEGEPVALGAVP